MIIASSRVLNVTISRWKSRFPERVGHLGANPPSFSQTDGQHVSTSLSGAA
jgi:hypothetical protein